MSILHEFRDAIVKELDDKESGLLNVLIKNEEAAAHNRTAGKIIATREIKTTIEKIVLRWSTRDEEGD